MFLVVVTCDTINSSKNILLMHSQNSSVPQQRRGIRLKGNMKSCLCSDPARTRSASQDAAHTKIAAEPACSCTCFTGAVHRKGHCVQTDVCHIKMCGVPCRVPCLLRAKMPLFDT